MTHLKAKKNSKVSIPGEYFDELIETEKDNENKRSLILNRIVHLKELGEQARAIHLNEDHFSTDEKTIGILNLSLEQMHLLNEEIKFLRKIL